MTIDVLMTQTFVTGINMLKGATYNSRMYGYILPFSIVFVFDMYILSLWVEEDVDDVNFIILCWERKSE